MQMSVNNKFIKVAVETIVRKYHKLIVNYRS